MTIKDHLYTARWAITKAINDNDYGAVLDLAAGSIIQAKALSITEEPERPDEPPAIIDYAIPEVVKVAGVKAPSRGNYRTDSGKAQGLVVHYTVSGRTKKSAKAVLSGLVRRGLCCMVMDEDGVIYVPENFDLVRDVGYHAGASSWKGKTSVSFYCMGMEICNWGRLNSETKQYAKDFRVSEGKDNVKKGEYEKYTAAQEESLINFIMWQLDTNPEFQIDWIVGHDEVAPTRKTDPGASLSMTMPQLRSHIKGLVKGRELK